MKEHYDPSCQPAVEPFQEGMPFCETIEDRVFIALAAEVRHVLKVGIDGRIIDESETYFVPQFVTEGTLSEDFDPDDDMPF